MMAEEILKKHQDGMIHNNQIIGLIPKYIIQQNDHMIGMVAEKETGIEIGKEIETETKNLQTEMRKIEAKIGVEIVEIENEVEIEIIKTVMIVDVNIRIEIDVIHLCQGQ